MSHSRPWLVDRQLVQWNFDTGPEGWTGHGDCQTDTADGCLRVKCTGEAPMLTSPPLDAEPGLLVVLRMRSSARGPASLVWMADHAFFCFHKL